MTHDDPADDLEWRLHAMLQARADAVDTVLDGPALRARAGGASRLRRGAPVLAAAAVVLGLGAGVAAVTVDRSGPGSPAPAGGHTSGGRVVAPSHPARPTPARTAEPRPSSPVVSVLSPTVSRPSGIIVQLPGVRTQPSTSAPARPAATRHG